MVNYQLGKIYSIRTHLNLDEFYIGSTAQQYLSQRYAEHIIKYKKGYLEERSKYLFDKYGIDNCYIELLESYSCNSKDELRQREGFHQRQYIGKGLVNKRIEGMTQKEYNKQYYETNKEKIAEYKKEYSEKNKEKILEKHKEYYEKNKEKINEKVICECGCVVLKKGLERHKKSNKHIELLKTKTI